MNTKNSHSVLKGYCVLLVCLGMLCMAGPIKAQPVSLSIQKNQNQTVVSWPTGLSLVQLQKATDPVVHDWQDLGAATIDDHAVAAIEGGKAFYRLRLLAPTIVTPPQGGSVLAGANFALNVAAEGTAPLAYQWQRNGAPLSGQTAASLVLASVQTSDAGEYTVKVTNRAGFITSQVALLTVSEPPSAPRGIYMGTFAGQTDNGGFAIMIGSDGKAVAVGYNTPQAEGVFAADFPVAVDGSFSVGTGQGGTATGTFTANDVAGTFSNSLGNSGLFNGTRQPDSGIQQAGAGYYAGTYSGAYIGDAYLIAAADGKVFFYVSDPVNSDEAGDDGGFGTLNAANGLSATVVASNLQIVGTLNPAVHQITGTYKLQGTTLGTFSLTRVATP